MTNNIISIPAAIQTGTLALAACAGGGGGNLVPSNPVAASVTGASGSNSAANSNATGSIGGAFYGPAEQQLGAIWSVNDGTTFAIGGIAASR